MDLSSIVVRQATAMDAVGIAVVHLAAWRHAYQHIFSTEALAAGLDLSDRTERWMNVLNDRNTTTLVAELRREKNREEIIGFVNFGRPREEDAPEESRPAGEIFAIYLSPEWWGKGIGARLASEAIDRLHQAGMKAVTLSVLEENERAVRFYGRMGFVFDGVPLSREMYGRTVSVHRYVLQMKSASSGC